MFDVVVAVFDKSRLTNASINTFTMGETDEDCACDASDAGKVDDVG